MTQPLPPREEYEDTSSDPFFYVGSLIKIHREARGMHVDELARKTGMSSISLDLIEQHKNILTFHDAAAICRALDIDLNDLILHGSTAWTPPPLHPLSLAEYQDLLTAIGDLRCETPIPSFNVITLVRAIERAPMLLPDMEHHVSREALRLIYELGSALIVQARDCDEATDYLTEIYETFFRYAAHITPPEEETNNEENN